MTKTTALPLLSLLTAFAVQACAAPTADDVSSDPMTPNAEIANAETSSPAASLAGRYGERPSTMTAGVEQPADGQVNAGGDVHAQLFVESRKQTYDVVDYSFGVKSNVDPMSGVLGGTKVSASLDFEALNLAVLKKAGVTSFSKDLLGNEPLGRIVLRQRDADGRFVDVAAFGGAKVTGVSSNANAEGLSENVVIHMTSLSIIQGKSVLTIDLLKGESTWAGTSPCGTSVGQIGPYMQTSSAMTVLAKDAKRVDLIDVAVSSTSYDPLSKGTFQGAMPHLDGIAVESAFETSSMCAAFMAAQGKPIASVRLGVVTSSSTMKAQETTSWEACTAFVEGVSFSSRFDTMGQRIELGAAGLIRTDRDAMGTTQVGWSFAKNAPIATCSETF